MAWRPGTRAARRIAAILLAAHRRGTITMSGPNEIVCLDAAMKSKYTPGTRVVLGRLWRTHGGVDLLTTDDEELRVALSA